MYPSNVLGVKKPANLHCAKATMTFNSVASLLHEICHNVQIEPHLQPLEGETYATSAVDDARL